MQHLRGYAKQSYSVNSLRKQAVNSMLQVYRTEEAETNIAAALIRAVSGSESRQGEVAERQRFAVKPTLDDCPSRRQSAVLYC